MDIKNQKPNISESKMSKLKNDLQSQFSEKNKDNTNIIKKKCKCPELLRKKCKLNFNEDLPYHIKKKFTKNILLTEKNDKIVLISKDEYDKNSKPTKEEKSSNKLPVVNSTKNKAKIDSKSHSQGGINLFKLSF